MKKDYTYIYNFLAGLLFAAAAVFDFIDKDISSGVTTISLGLLFVALGFYQKKKGRIDKSK
jgi:uncharacterized membrane protein